MRSTAWLVSCSRRAGRTLCSRYGASAFAFCVGSPGIVCSCHRWQSGVTHLNIPHSRFAHVHRMTAVSFHNVAASQTSLALRPPLPYVGGCRLPDPLCCLWGPVSTRTRGWFRAGDSASGPDFARICFGSLFLAGGPILRLPRSDREGRFLGRRLYSVVGKVQEGGGESPASLRGLGSESAFVSSHCVIRA
jgi:hypothetical protein